MSQDTPPVVDKTTPPASTAQRAGPRAANSRHRAALTAGGALLLMAVVAGVATLVVVQGLVPDGTERVVVESETTFRLAVAGLYVVIVLDVLVAWALMRVFHPVHAGLSQLAGWFRLAYSAVFLVAIAQLNGIPELLSSRETSAFTPAQVDALALVKVEAYNDIWMAGLLLFGVHLALLGYLTHRSAQMPNLLAILLVVAGLGYAFDTFAAVMSTGSPFPVSTVTFLGEFVLALWLLIRGHRLTPDDMPLPPHTARRGARPWSASDGQEPLLGVLIRASIGAIVTYFVLTFLLPTLFGLLAANASWFRTLQPWVDFQFAQSGLFIFDTALTGQQWAHIGVSGLIWLVLPLLVGLRIVMRAEVK
jgi:hypothetical protein